MKKIVSLIVAVLLLVTCFAACGGNAEQPNANATAGADETQVADSKFAGQTLTMGTNPAFPPYEMIDDNGTIIGIDADIAKAVADKLGMTLEIKDMEFKSLVPAVQSGTIDIALAGMSVTEERKESVDFTDTYATGIQVIIVKEDSEIKSVEDLKDHLIGVQTGTTGDIYCTDEFGADFVKQFSNGSIATQALINGQIDCVVIDNEPAKNFVAANEGLKILETEYANEDYAAAISKDNPELLEAVNGALKELTEDGTIATIIARYINAD